MVKDNLDIQKEVKEMTVEKFDYIISLLDIACEKYPIVKEALAKRYGKKEDR